MHRLEINNIVRHFNSSPEPNTPDAETMTGDGKRHAAVAAILRPGKSHTEALFILRSKKEGDPWSGQMAFPGGHYETHDESLRHTAERETLEEIGLDLVAHAHYVGKIPDVHAQPRGKAYKMVVSPYVYVLENLEADMSLNYEVAEVLWGSLNDMYTGTSKTTQEFEFMGRSEHFPGYNVGGEVVWGLTLRMLDNFFTRLNPDWQPI